MTNTPTTRHVRPLYGAPDIARLPAGQHASEYIGPKTLDSVQTYANNHYSQKVSPTALQAEKAGIINLATRKGMKKDDLEALFNQISNSAPAGQNSSPVVSSERAS